MKQLLGVCPKNLAFCFSLFVSVHLGAQNTIHRMWSIANNDFTDDIKQTADGGQGQYKFDQVA